MTDLLTLLDRRRRPPLLIRAARIGVTDYRRETALRRHLNGARPPGHDAALGALMEIEEEQEQARRTRAAGYSPARHVDVLIAVMGEARLLRAAHR